MAAETGSRTLRSILKEFSSDHEGKEQYSITHFKNRGNGRITKIPSYQIYKESMLSRLNFLCGSKIKTLEHSFPLKTKQKDTYLLSRDAIREYRSKYQFLHIGLVQVTITALGYFGRCDGKVLTCLRNEKNAANFEETILAAFESSFEVENNIKFNWFPNFSCPLSDLAKSNGLVITSEGLNFGLAKGCENAHVFAITYRVCYKLMKSSLEPRSLYESPVLEVNTENATIIVPKSSNPINS